MDQKHHYNHEESPSKKMYISPEPRDWWEIISDRISKVISGELPDNKEMVILDVGSGGGGISIRVSQKTNPNSKIVSVDISKRFSYWAKKSCKASGVENVFQVIGDGGNLPIKNEKIDFVFCCGSLHHFPEPGFTLKGFYNCLKSGGNSLIFDPNLLSPAKLLYLTFSKFSPKKRTPHEREFTEFQLKNFSKEAEFRKNRISYTFFLLPFLMRVLPKRIILCRSVGTILFDFDRLLTRIPIVRFFSYGLSNHSQK